MKNTVSLHGRARHSRVMLPRAQHFTFLTSYLTVPLVPEYFLLCRRMVGRGLWWGGSVT